MGCGIFIAATGLAVPVACGMYGGVPGATGMVPGAGIAVGAPAHGAVGQQPVAHFGAQHLGATASSTTWHLTSGHSPTTHAFFKSTRLWKGWPQPTSGQ